MTTSTVWLQSNAMNALWTPALGLILDFAVKGLVLMALAWLAALAMRRASAAARHLVWALALGGLLVLPVFSLVMPKWQLPVLPRDIPASNASSEPATRGSATGAGAPNAMAKPDVPGEGVQPPNPLTPAPLPARAQTAARTLSPGREDLSAGATLLDGWATSPDGLVLVAQSRSASAARTRWAFWLVAAWLAGFAAVLAPLLAGLFAAGRLVRRARPFQRSGWPALTQALGGAMGLCREVRVLCAGPGAMPMAVGLFRAAILLPAEAEDWPDEKRRAVLLHELAHVRRRDCLTHALGHVALALHWCNPLAWLALRRLRIERERACDDLVLLAGERPSAYAEHLLDVARTLRSGALASVAAITMAQPGQLEGRLAAVLDPKRKRRVLRRTAIVVGVLLVLAITVPLAMLKFSEARVFAKMTPEQKAGFDEWYTKKIALPPEALEVKPFAPETVEAVHEFFRQWAAHKDEAFAIQDAWYAALEPGQKADRTEALPEGFVAQHQGALASLDPLLAAFKAVVERPDYSMDTWSGTPDPDRQAFAPGEIPYGSLENESIRSSVRLCRLDALAKIQENRMAEAITSANAILACAHLDPYGPIVEKMMADLFLREGTTTFRTIAERTADPELRSTILRDLEAHRAKIRFDPPVPIPLATLDQIGMVRQAQRMGVVVDIQNKTGPEILFETGRVQADCLERFALPQETDPAKRQGIEQTIRAYRETKPLSGRTVGLKGYFIGWVQQIVVATLYSIALPNTEAIRKHAQGVLEQYDDLIASVRDEDLAKSRPPATAPGPTLPEPVPPASVVSSAGTTAADSIDAKRAIEMLVSEKLDEQSKGASILADGSEKPREAIAPLVTALLGKAGVINYSQVQTEARRSLGTFGETAVEPLIERLDSLDRKTSEGVDKIGRIADALAEVGPPALPRLMSALGKKTDRAAIVAPQALGHMGDGALKPLLGALRQGLPESGASPVVGLGSEPSEQQKTDAEVRAAAAEALGKTKSPEVVPPLIERLGDEDGPVRASSAMALGALRTTQAVEPLIERLSDPYKQVQINAAYALGKIGDRRAVEPLLAVAREDKTGFGGQALQALGTIGGAETGSSLVDLLKTSSGDAQLRILSTLTYMQNPLAMGNSKARDAFIAIANDPEAPLRNRTLAVGGLRLFQDAASMDALERMLRDASEKPELRKEAAKSLGLLGTPGVDRLAALLHGNDASLQALAGSGLREATISSGYPDGRYTLYWELYLQALRSLVTDAASQTDLDAVAQGNEFPPSTAGKSQNPRIRAAAQAAQKIADEELRLSPIGPFAADASRRIVRPDTFPWGDGAGGLLCRIRVHQPDFMEIRDSGGEHLWNDADPPVVKLDLRNDSRLEYRFPAGPNPTVEVEVDGVKYAGPAVATDAATTATNALVAGWQHNAIPVVLDRRYTHEKLPLSWMPGKHQVRLVATVLPPSTNPRGTSVRLTSNPIEIAIVSAAPGGQGQSGHYEKDGIHLEAGFVPDKTEKLLGEDVALTFFVKNVGTAPFGLVTGGDGRGVRPTRFKISAVDERGRKVTDPNAQERNMGGLMGMPQLAPGGSYTEPLALSKWCLFDKPGVYTVTCRTVLELTKEAGFPTDQSAYTHLPIATSFTLTLKAPSSGQAKRIVADALTAAATKKEVSGNLPVAADAVRSPQYLPSLLKAARRGDRAAIQAIGGIQTPEATNALIELAQGWLGPKNLDLALAALDPVRPRMPDPRYYRKDEQTGTENEGSAPDRLRVEKSWRPAMVKPMLAMGRQLAKNTDQKSLGLAMWIFEDIGMASDMPDMIEGYTHAIDATRTLPFETWQYFRPRGATYGFRFATAQLLERGGKVPTKPATPGEAAVYLIALNRKSDQPFRPADWPQMALRWLKSDVPYMRELVLDYLPEPVPEEVLAMLPTFLGDSYVDLQISACRLARDHPREIYKEPLLKILREGQDKYAIGAAAEAAAANGVTDDEIETLWNARAAKPADRSGEKTDLNWLKDARKFMKGGQPMRPN